MRNNQGYRKLIAWQIGNKLDVLIYDVTGNFPKSELFGITSQMRRAVLSVCANIAEGYSRNGLKDRAHFYQMSLGSLTELEFFIDFAFERKYMSKEDHQMLIEIETECAKVLIGLLRSTRL